MEYLAVLLLGVLIGVCIMIVRLKVIGILQIVRIEQEEPYIFLELNDGQSIQTISKCKCVVLRVNDPKKPRN